jgi:4-hydroxy-3-methylbut-2-enyl diphosphate reductase
VNARNARNARIACTARTALLLVIAPLRLERAAVRCGLPQALVLRSGTGAARARSAALVAARIPVAALAVAGFCGAAAEGLRAGDLVVASEVRGSAGVTACASGPLVAALASLGIERIRVGPVASVDHLVRGAERRVLAGEGVLAVDMESAWLAPAAVGRPFAVLRIVLDTPAREIYRPLATLAGGLAAWRALRRAAPALALWARAQSEGEPGAASARQMSSSNARAAARPRGGHGSRLSSPSASRASPRSGSCRPRRRRAGPRCTRPA